MPDTWPDIRLARVLRARNVRYFGTLDELRDTVAGWLEYIPATFPHYTRHTVSHSDEILLQLSLLLVDEKGDLLVPLSDAEIYVLCASAYLHDIGMVASDTEKAEILKSESWLQWTTGDGGGAQRWLEIQDLRSSSEPPDEVLRAFLADVEVRFLLAEFVRRVHPGRAARLITDDSSIWSRFGFDDPIVCRTIADVCASHGLAQHELLDEDRYPERRNLRGDEVNVRFLSLLLRIGDLLDLRTDRACPLLLSAASPLPADSLAHWTQYQRIVHRLTAPDIIQLEAECRNQQEHSYLLDWCQWLVKELQGAAVLMARATRHHGWTPPHASLEQPATIDIRPAPRATYVFSRWQIELDPTEVLRRLVSDVSHEPLAFVRELLQNSLDATRCRMYLDLDEMGVPRPDYPDEAGPSIREMYPIEISLSEIVQENQLSGQKENAHALSITDNGIGMNRDIIERFLLQVGRSYYQSEEFRRSFGFFPSSRFGVGFLSVFGPGEVVTVDTLRAGGNDAEPIKLTLTGPRAYLLTEKGERRSPGTSITVQLREPLARDALSRAVKAWCRRVEFPIHVNEHGRRTVVRPETSADFVYEVPDVSQEGATLGVRAFPTNVRGVSGDIYVFVRRFGDREDWGCYKWASSTYPARYPGARVPAMPNEATFHHGIAFSPGWGARQSVAARVDIRTDRNVTLSREEIHDRTRRWPEEIETRVIEILDEHLAPHRGDANAWRYKQSLMDEFPVPAFWVREPDSVRMTRNAVMTSFSVADAQKLESIHTVSRMDFSTKRDELTDDEMKRAQALLHADAVILPVSTLTVLSEWCVTQIFQIRRPARVLGDLDARLMIVEWQLGDAVTLTGLRDYFVTEFDTDELLGLSMPSVFGAPGRTMLVNVRHPILKWMREVEAAIEAGDERLPRDSVSRIAALMADPIGYSGLRLEVLNVFLQRWRDDFSWLEAPLLPPERPLSFVEVGAFRLRALEVSRADPELHLRTGEGGLSDVD
jgi:hypothetical protein